MWRFWGNNDRPISERVLQHLRMPLFLNGYALIFGALASSGLGLVYWVVTARYYPEETLGLQSALLSTVLLLASIAQLSMNTVLVRFIPIAGQQTGRLIGWVYLISSVLSGLVALGFVFVGGVWIPAMRFLATSPGWAAAFVLSVMAWNIFSLQDCALTGLRQARWIPLENITVVVGKIILLVWLARQFQSTGIFVSSMVPVLIALLPINGLIFKKLIPQHERAITGNSGELNRRSLTTYVTGNYLAAISLSVSNTVLPLLVTNHVGVRANAYFSPPWMIASVLQFVAINMASSLTVEASLDRSKLKSYFWRSLIQTMGILLPGVLLILAAAPVILQIFGQSYAEGGSTTLRWLALSTLPNVVISFSIALARVQNRTQIVSLIQVTLCVALLGLSEIFLPIWGIAGVGFARFVSQGAMAVIVMATFLWASFKAKSNQG
jgi:O-antigen/teichoic acid export membrane protein